MAKNTNLHKARKTKNDEFYTQLSDVENELKHYKEHFKDKIILCNCDDPVHSAFWRYFHLNFTHLGLKKLISTHYLHSQFKWDINAEKPYVMIYEGGNDNDINVGNKTYLNGDGDFRSAECIEFLKECDIVVTNPPFSLFREFIAILVKYEKKFIVIGNSNAITYKKIFPLIKNNEMWLGINHVKEFIQPDGSIKKFGNICWFANLDNNKRHEKLILCKNYTPEAYPKYDNYDAINVDKVADIPMDYDGVMGVPITFLDHYNPEQFDIIAFRKGDDGKDLVFTREREREFNRTFVSLYDLDSGDDKKQRREDMWNSYLRKNNNQTEIEPIDYFFPSAQVTAGVMNAPYETSVNGKNVYKRILIHRRCVNGEECVGRMRMRA